MTKNRSNYVDKIEVLNEGLKVFLSGIFCLNLRRYRHQEHGEDDNGGDFDLVDHLKNDDHSRDRQPIQRRKAAAHTWQWRGRRIVISIRAKQSTHQEQTILEFFLIFY